MESRRATAINNQRDYDYQKMIKEEEKRQKHRHNRALVLDDVDDEDIVYRHVSTKPYRSPYESGGNYNSVSMPLMKTSCRPENTGYFGSTGGSPPVELQYGIYMEATPLGQIETIIESVKERIMDEILSRSYPSVCGYVDYTYGNDVDGEGSNTKKKKKKGLTPANGFKFSHIEGPTEGT